MCDLLLNILFNSYNFALTGAIQEQIKKFTHSYNRPGQIACPMPIRRARTYKTSETRPIFRARTFCLLKRKKKTLDVQVFSRKGKAMKKLQ